MQILMSGLFLIAVPAVLQLRGARVHTLFAGAGVAYAILWVIAAFTLARITATRAAPQSALHDTYYVVQHYTPPSPMVILMLGLFAVHWGQARYLRVPYPKLAVRAFWGLHLTTLMALFATPFFATALMPRRYVDDPAYMATLNNITALSAFTAWVFIGLLFAMLALSLVQHMRR